MFVVMAHHCLIYSVHPYPVTVIISGWLASRCPHLMAEVLTVREYVSITNNAIGETLATEVLRRREVRRPLRPFWRRL